MEELGKYVPILENGEQRTVPTHADGLSVERMNDAKLARCADLRNNDKLLGLEQTPQEFHHRGLMLQVSVLILLIRIIFLNLNIIYLTLITQSKSTNRH